MALRPVPGLRKLFCCYCKRELAPAHLELPHSATRDHVRAVADGGKRWVPCCRKCNQLKGDLPADDWFWFIATHPRWWKLFDTAAQVFARVREFRFAQAMAKQRDARRIG